MKIEGEEVVVKLYGKSTPCEDYSAGEIIPLRHIPGSKEYLRHDENYRGRWMVAAICGIVGVFLLIILAFASRKKKSAAA